MPERDLESVLGEGVVNLCRESNLYSIHRQTGDFLHTGFCRAFLAVDKAGSFQFLDVFGCYCLADPQSFGKLCDIVIFFGYKLKNPKSYLTGQSLVYRQ